MQTSKQKVQWSLHVLKRIQFVCKNEAENAARTSNLRTSICMPTFAPPTSPHSFVNTNICFRTSGPSTRLEEGVYVHIERIVWCSSGCHAATARILLQEFSKQAINEDYTCVSCLCMFVFEWTLQELLVFDGFHYKAIDSIKQHKTYDLESPTINVDA